MTDYIPREAVLEILRMKSAPWDAYQKVQAIPAADVRPVVRGRDISYQRRGTDCDFMCSECGAWVGSVMWGTLDGGNFKFCPNCGAEMREES